MENFIVEVGGTSQHITAKNSKKEFDSFESAIENFTSTVSDLNISDSDVEIDLALQKADTSIIGNDYVVTLYRV